MQIVENAANFPAVAWTTIRSPRLEVTLTPPPIGTLLVLISSSAAEEVDGAGVAAGNNVAIRKPLEILIGTFLRGWVLGPLSFFPVRALKTDLSVGQEIFPDLKPDKFVASAGQLAM